MQLERADWSGLLDGPRHQSKQVKLVGLVDRNDRTGSGAFKALTDHGRWWVKPLNNPQGPRVPITELIIGRAGAFIKAPVCEVAVIQIPSELVGEQYHHSGLVLEPGFASGSKDLGGVQEERDLLYRDEDDNRQRQAGIFALYDWCWGGDDQWLYAPVEENRIYSHDHGHYLPGAPAWTAAQLVAQVDVAHPQGRSAHGLDASALLEYRDRLSGLTRSAIVDMLKEVPAEWPITQDELETVGWFLERRASQVAPRLQQLAGQV